MRKYPNVIVQGSFCNKSTHNIATNKCTVYHMKDLAYERVPEMQVIVYLASGQVSVLPFDHAPVKLTLSSVRPLSLTFSHCFSSLAKLQF